jgi:hypothetical protein
VAPQNVREVGLLDADQLDGGDLRQLPYRYGRSGVTALCCRHRRYCPGLVLQDGQDSSSACYHLLLVVVDKINIESLVTGWASPFIPMRSVRLSCGRRKRRAELTGGWCGSETVGRSKRRVRPQMRPRGDRGHRLANLRKYARITQKLCHLSRRVLIASGQLPCKWKEIKLSAGTVFL